MNPIPIRQSVGFSAYFPRNGRAVLWGERKRNLWRIDHLNHQLYLMLLSPDKPDLSAAAAIIWYVGRRLPMGNKIVYSFAGKNNSRQCLAFPFWWPIPQKAVCPNREERGKVHAHVSVPHQKNGCRPVRLTTVFVKRRGILRLFTVNGIFSQNPSQETKVRLLAVTYEGVLTVTDTELFCKALTEGIGRGKAYGMGLLTVAKVASNER